MSDDGELAFKVGIVGPSRVGKTSMIASILKDGQRLLEGTPVIISPRGTATERRIAQHSTELAGSILAGEFNPGAVQGTEEKFTFELHIDPGVASAGIHLDILDFPGGWLDTNRRPQEREKDWKACKGWLKESTVLLVPIESAVLMEAAAAKHRAATPAILAIYDVKQVALEWAKNRAARPDEPALLMLCPVKCESYFADNGGQRDSSGSLSKMVDKVYAEVVEAVRKEATNVKILYAPIDTIGCVEIIQASWKEDANAPGGYEFTADYRVRPPNRQAVKGADAILVSVCRHLIEAATQVKSGAWKQKQEEALVARQHADKDEGFLSNFWIWVSGELNQRRLDANAKIADAGIHRQNVEDLHQIIERLAKRDIGSRVRKI